MQNKKIAGAVLALAVGVTSTTVMAGPAEANNRGARIKGTVVTLAGAVTVPLEGIVVSTWQQSDTGTWVFRDEDTTDATGAYHVGKLGSGVFRVRYDDPTGMYATEFYNDVDRIEDAEGVDLDKNEMTTLADAELESAAHLLGTVTGSDDLPIAGAEVTAYVPQASSWTAFRKVLTDADGKYDLGGLSAGNYVLGFWDPASNVTEYWEDAASLADADQVTVPTAVAYNAKLATPAPVTPAPITPAPVSPAPTTTAAAPVTTAAPTTAPVQLAVTVLKKPRIKGLKVVGERLRVTKGTWSPGTVKRKIQWLANGKRIKGATKNRLRLTQKLLGKRISVRVIASAPGFTPLKVTSKRTKKIVA